MDKSLFLFFVVLFLSWRLAGTSNTLDPSSFLPPLSLQETAAQANTDATVQQFEDSIFEEGYWTLGKGQKKRLGGLIETDFRYFTNSDEGICTFLIRRARLYATGVIDDIFGYMLMPQWDNGKAGLHFVWIETVTPESIRFRMGLFKEPFSLEALYTEFYWDFVSWSLGTMNFLQIEDLGAMLFGKTWKKRLEYGFGVFNGRGTALDNNQSKELVGRIVLQPFATWTYFLMKELYIGVSGSTGRQNETLTGTGFYTEAGTEFLTFLGSSAEPVEVNATRVRLGADVEFYRGPLVVRAEYLHVNWGDITHGKTARLFRGWSAYVESSYLLTGEKMPRGTAVIPKRNFDFRKCYSLGAFALAVRYEFFVTPQSILNAHLATGSNRVQGYTAGLNWFFNPHMEMKLDYQNLHFNHRVEVGSHFVHQESTIILRLQVEF